MDFNNLFVSVSFPNLNFNISRSPDKPLERGGQVTGQERFYSVSMGVEVQVRMIGTCHMYTSVEDVNGTA